MASSVWKGHIAFGLVSIPVKMCCAARAESIAFCQLRASDHSRVGMKQYAKADDKLVTKEEIVKGYEVTKDRYIVITEEDIKSAAPASSGNAEIVEFIPADELDPIYFEQSYWLAPDAGGDKAYALLFDGLRSRDVVAIAKLTMHNREHVIALRAGKTGIAVHTLFYPHEARSADEYRTDVGRITPGESALAGKLIEALAASLDLSKYRDSYRDNILEMIEAKQNGEAAPAPAKRVQAPAMDLMAALTASLVKAPGPVSAPAAPAKKKKSKVAA